MSQELIGVDPSSTFTDFEMKVWSRSPARLSHEPDEIAFLDVGSFFHQDLAQVGVQHLVLRRLQDDVVSVSMA